MKWVYYLIACFFLGHTCGIAWACYPKTITAVSIVGAIIFFALSHFPKKGE